MIERQTLFQQAFLHYPRILTGFDCRDALAEARTIISSQQGRSIDGVMGAAFERLCMYEVTATTRSVLGFLGTIFRNNLNHPAVASLETRLSLTTIPPLGGMTSHRDYSRNKLALGTFVLEGKLLFGAGGYGSTPEVRAKAYEHLAVAGERDLCAVYAPAPLESNEHRPNFCVFALEPTIAVRVWLHE